MNHDELVNEIVRECERLGLQTKLEVALPHGRGAADIACFKKGKPIFYAEVKSSPTSFNKKKVQKQLNRYEEYFGEGKDYILICPSVNAIYVQPDSSRRIELRNYLNKFAQ